MWSLCSRYDNPTWPNSEKKLVVSINAMEDDDDHVHDTSVSYSKGTFTGYLQATYRRSAAAGKKEMKQAVTKAWKTAAPQARPALTVITDDAEAREQSRPARARRRVGVSVVRVAAPPT